MSHPVRYTPSVETIALDEGETIAALREQFALILETTSNDYGHAVRAVHAKGHGLAKATLTVKPDLPPELEQGIFAKAGSYQAILRFSTNAGDILDDAIKLPRGLALKIIGVEGERLSASREDATQDFVMVNGPIFAAADPKKFLGNLKLLAKTTDKAEGLKKAISMLFRGAEAALEAVGAESAFLQTLGGAKPVHPLGATYYTQVPFRYGDYIAKFSLVPISSINDLAEETVSTFDKPDAIRTAINEALAEQGAQWELRVQLCTDLETMPIEDASALWDEEASPFLTVATLTAAPQLGWEDDQSEALEDGLAFSPWHGVVAHQPLGGVNRARKESYAFSADYRGRFNGCPIHEPRPG